MGVVFHRELDSDLQHHRCEEGHPRGAVGLLQVAAGWQRAAAIEDADVIQAEEPSREYVVAIDILAVHPPGEIQRELLEAELEEGQVAAPAELLVVAVNSPDRPRVNRRIDVGEVPFVGRHLAVWMQIVVTKEQL